MQAAHVIALGDLAPGLKVSVEFSVDAAQMRQFAALSGDFNPLHTDETFASRSPLKTRIAHGMLTMAVATGLANQMGIFEGTTVALMQQTIQYKGAVKFGETVHLVMTVKDRKETKHPSRGVVTFDVPILNQNGDVVVQSEWVLMMARRPQPAA